MWNLKYDTKELMYETEADSKTTDLWLPGGSGMGERCIGGLGRVDENCYTQRRYTTRSYCV